MKDKNNVKSDYEYSRDTYYELLEKGKMSLETMMEVARESEHPRAFCYVNLSFCWGQSCR